MDTYAELYACKRCNAPITIREGYCYSCMPQQKPHPEVEVFTKKTTKWPSREIVANIKALHRPVCHLCKKPRHKHDPKCLWKKGGQMMQFKERIKKERNPITDYRCAKGHEFKSNLPKDAAICPDCRLKNVVWVGESYVPEPIFGARPF